MYNKFNIIFNDTSSLDLGIEVIKRPEIPSPQPIYTSYEIPGKNGKEYELEGYEDIEIEVNFNFLDRETMHERFLKCKRWINTVEDNKLIFSDNPGVFYRVNYATITSNERFFKVIGKFTVTFNCEPFAYEVDGQNEIEINSSAIVFNNGDFQSKPIIKIKGEGIITINVNDEIIKVNVGQNIILDSYLELSYKEDKTPQNNNVQSKKYPVLKLGENNISYSGGRVDSFTIIPNWVIY